MKNYHTHTFRCMHATGKDEDYVIAAIEAGITQLGFSDHTPWKYNSDFVAGMRMHISQFDDYYKSIASLKEKYKDQIDIKIGLECEYFPRYMKWLKDLVKEYNLDYLILGHHYIETDEHFPYVGTNAKDNDYLNLYIESTIEGLSTGLFSYVAHPDLYCKARYWDKQCEQAAHKLCAYCKEHDILMEYNLAGARYTSHKTDMKYPHEKFWEIAAQYSIKAIIGIDAHNPKDLKDKNTYNYALKYLQNLGIEVVEDIKFFNE